MYENKTGFLASESADMYFCKNGIHE